MRCLLLLFVPWLSLLMAQTPMAVQTGGGPRLTADLGDGRLPIRLEALEIDVQVRGYLAETTFSMTFFNDDSRTLEGELLLPLPTGATVSGYALDVFGMMVDGVAVEKDDARIAFESEVSKSIDPGILEKAAGNTYRLRVYPIFPNKRRKVRVSYVTHLEIKDKTLAYVLPLNDYPSLSFALSLGLEGRDRPDLHSPVPGLELKRDGDRWTASSPAALQRPNGELRITWPRSSQPRTFFERDKQGNTWFLIGDVPASDSKRQKKFRPRHLTLFWDASLSRRDLDHEREFAVLKAIIFSWRPREIRLVTLRDRPSEPAAFLVKRGSCPRLIEFLKELDYDGATNLGVLTSVSGLPADAALLFSDGLHNLGGDRVVEAPVPFFCFSNGGSGNPTYLELLARNSGGAFFDLQRWSPKQLASEMILRPVKTPLLSYDPAIFSDVFAVGQTQAPGRYFVTGRLLADSGSLGLGKKARSIRVPVPPELNSGGKIISLFWARQELARLSAAPQQNRLAILELGKRHGLVTPFTSLIVLETYAQYLAYHIPPPESLAVMRAKYFAEVGDGKKEAEEIYQEYETDLEELWFERLEVWAETFSFPATARNEVPTELASLDAEPEPTPAVAEPDLEPTPAVAESPEPVVFPFPELQQASMGGVISYQGEVLPGASITFSSEVLAGGERTVVSDENGHYLLSSMPPGEYKITWSYSGFMSVHSGIIFESGMRLRHDVILRVGMHEQLVVAAEPSEPATGSIKTRAWDPQVPYLARLKKVGKRLLYRTYLVERETYGQNPGFYLDCAYYFFAQGQRDLGKRITSNLLELGLEQPQLIRLAAVLYMQEGAWDEAIELHKKLAAIRPEQPQGRGDQALALVARGDQHRLAGQRDLAVSDYRDALSLLYDVIKHPWGSISLHLHPVLADQEDYEGTELTWLIDYNRVLGRLQALGQTVPADRMLPKKLISPIKGDLRVTLSWDDPSADINLWVYEPSGEKVWNKNSYSFMGGELSADLNQGLGPAEYFLKRAMPGTYFLAAKYNGNNAPSMTGPTTLILTVYRNLGGADEKMTTSVVRLDNPGEIIDLGSVVIEERSDKKSSSGPAH